MATRRADHDPPNKQARPKKPKPTFNPEDLKSRELLTVAETAWLLHVGENKVYDLILRPDPLTGKPKLFSVKLGALRRIPPRAIQRFLEG